MYQIIYRDLVSDKAFLRRRPGQKPFICFDNKLKGDTEHTLNALIRLIDADRALTNRQKLPERIIFLEDTKNPIRGLEYVDQPVLTIDPQEADFCRN